MFNLSLGLIILGCGITAWQFGEATFTAMFFFWFHLPLYTFHQFEEYIFPGKYAQWFNRNVVGSHRDDSPISPHIALLINFPIVGLTILFFFLLSSQFTWLGLIPLFSSMCNGLFHLYHSVREKRYIAGTITGIPLIVITFHTSYQLLTHDVITTLSMITAFIIGALLNSLLSGSLFIIFYKKLTGQLL